MAEQVAEEDIEKMVESKENFRDVVNVAFLWWVVVDCLDCVTFSLLLNGGAFCDKL